MSERAFKIGIGALVVFALAYSCHLSADCADEGGVRVQHRCIAEDGVIW